MPIFSDGVQAGTTGSWLKAPTKTITFDGTAGNGAVGTVTVWTITGRVLAIYISAFCTQTLTGAATLEFGTTTTTTDFIAQIASATSLATNDWWIGTASPASSGQMGAGALEAFISANPILTIGSTAITGGTLVFDCFYLPLTSNGALS